MDLNNFLLKDRLKKDEIQQLNNLKCIITGFI